MGKRILIKRITTAIFVLALAVLPTGAFLSAHTHSYVLSNAVESYYARDATTHRGVLTHYMVCKTCGHTEKFEIAERYDTHKFGGGVYNGVNQHIGTQHRVQYKKTCTLCGFSVTEWGDPYPCPGNGNCIVVNSMTPAER